MGPTGAPSAWRERLLGLAGDPRGRLALGAALAVYFAAHVTRFHWGAVWPLGPRGDTWILFTAPRRILAQGSYPSPDGTLFPYAPPAIALLGSLAAAGPALFAVGWMAAMAAGLLATLRLSLAGEAPRVARAWLGLAAIALVLADGAVAWDLRNGNSNLICLGLVMAAFALARRRPLGAGLLLGLSAAVKPHAVLLPAYGLLIGAPALVLGAAAASVALWILLPVLLLGPAGTLGLYHGWQQQLQAIGSPVLVSRFAEAGPPLITLRQAAMALGGGPPDGASTRALLGALLLAWMLALAFYAGRACRPGGLPSTPGRAMLSDWVVLLVAPLPWNPWLEPYHAVALVPGVMLLLEEAVDPSSEGSRAPALAALGAIGLTRVVPYPFALSGLVLLLRLLFLAAALAVLRPALARRAPRSPAAPPPGPSA